MYDLSMTYTVPIIYKYCDVSTMVHFTYEGVKMRRYTNIALPDELAKQIDNVIKTAELGYKTKSEFVKEAVREKLIELSKFGTLKKSESQKRK